MEKKSSPTPDTVRAIIDLWPTRRVLGEDISVGEARIHKWAQANAIPARFHHAVITAAKARGFDWVTADLMVTLHGNPPAVVGIEAAE